MSCTYCKYNYYEDKFDITDYYKVCYTCNKVYCKRCYDECTDNLSFKYEIEESSHKYCIECDHVFIALKKKLIKKYIKNELNKLNNSNSNEIFKNIVSKILCNTSLTTELFDFLHRNLVHKLNKLYLKDQHNLNNSDISNTKIVKYLNSLMFKNLYISDLC